MNDVMLVVGFLVIVQTSGIDLTTFHVLAGAVGVGIGFGLQNIVSNFISGLIVMVERPISPKATSSRSARAAPSSLPPEGSC